MTDKPRLVPRRIAALAFSVLLLSSAVAPALAAPVAPAAEPSADDASLEATAPELDSTVTELESASHDSSASGPPASLPGANATTFSGEVVAESEDEDPPSSDANRTRVTLLTGQTVTVVEEGDRTRYLVSGDDRMRQVSTENATYVYPVGVDFETFDRHLFDVGFLIEQNLTDAETDSIPIIVSGPEERRVGADERNAESVLDAVEGVRSGATLESIDAEAGAVTKNRTARAYASFAADEAVERVTLDVKYRLDVDDAGNAVSAPRARQTHGVSGEGVTVAIVDSGIDNSHPAIDRVDAREDFTNEPQPGDPRGHGTHVAGIVASDNETYTGMAPNASLLDVRVLTADGWGYTSWIVSGMEYAVERNADVVSMSIGGPVRSERSNDRYTEAVNSAVESGTLVVTSAGNGGTRGSVSTPGIQSAALTVGASTDEGRVAGFSSRGPTEFGHFVKPNLVAPGVGVMSAEAGTEGFVSKRGTSMAAPAVGGVAALVLEKHPDWSPAQVKSVLTGTADPLRDRRGRMYDAYTQGAGEVDAADALETGLVATPGTVDFGTVRNGTTHSRTVTLTNAGDEPLTVDANATATDIDDGNTESVRINRSNVSLGPGETTHLELTVDTDLPPGTYSGRLSLGGDHAVVFGFVRLHEVVVEKRAAAAAAGSVEDDPVWLFADGTGREKITGEAGRERLGGDGSSVTYHMLGGGRYNVLSEGIDEGTGQPVVFSKTLTVDGDERVTLDERDTVEYGLDTAEIESTRGPISTRSVRVEYATRTSSGKEYGGAVTAASPDSPTVRFGRNAELDATIGRMLVVDAAGDEATNASQATAAAFDAPAAYHLVHRVDGVSGDRTTTVEPDALAEKHLTYYRSERGESYDVTMTASAPGGFEHVVSGGVGDRRNQTVYVDDRVAIHDVNASGTGVEASKWDLSGSATTLHGADAVHGAAVNRHPYVGDLRWRVSGGELFYYAATQADGDGHRFAEGTRNRVELRKNGDLDFGERFPEGSGWRDTDRSVRPGDDLELTVVGRNDATPLSSRTVTTHRATYDPDADYEPPTIESVAVRDLTTNNTAGGRLAVEFAVSKDAESVEALLAADADSVPFDSDPTGETDAGGWKAGSVERVESKGGVEIYEATFDAGERFGDRLGPVDLAITASDERGNTVEATTFDAVRVDAHPPSVAVETLGATDAPSAVSEGPVYTNGTLTVNATTGDAPNDARDVSLALSADFASFRTHATATRTDGRNWTVAEDLSDLPDDGSYTAEAVARDRFGNANRTVAGTVVLDRAAPELGATVTRDDDGTGRVTVAADERLRTAPEVRVELPNGTRTAVAVSRTDANDAGTAESDATEWTGTFKLADADGAYVATATGADLAGNAGRAVSTATVESVVADSENSTTVVVGDSDGAEEWNAADDSTVVSDSSVADEPGAFVRLQTDRPTNDTATVTRSRSALAPLSRNLVGVEFLNADLGSELAANLEDATVGIPANESRLPPGVESGEVRIGRYDATTGDWELLGTDIRNETVAGTTREYWVAEVGHLSTDGANFSTYGAVVADRAAPTLDAGTTDGVVYEDNAGATVEFAYSDDLSGVDPSAVEFYVDDGDPATDDAVTDDSATTVTSEYARYDASDLGYGDYTARVVVVDRAGNAENYTTSFGVVADDDPPRALGAPLVDGTELSAGDELPAGTESPTLDVRFTDDGIGVNADAIRVRFDGTDVTDDAAVTRDGGVVDVSYTPDGLSDGSSHALEVDLEDEKGNADTYVYELGIAEPSSRGGGGSGGSGGAGGGSGGGGSAGVPPPAVQIELIERGDGHVRATVTSARADAPGRISPDGGLVGGDVAFRTVGVAPASADPEPRFLLDLDSAAAAPAGVGTFEGANETLGYLTATPTYVTDAELDAVTVTFEVDAATTDAPEGVSLSRYRDGDWERLDTELVGERGGSYRFRASADATGTFAVGLDEPSFAVRDASLDASEVAVGDAVEVTATVENVGTLPGSETVALAVDGDPGETAEITLGPGERTTVRFSRAFETPGERVLGVGIGDADAEAGTLTAAGTLAVTADRAEADETTAGAGESGVGEGTSDSNGGDSDARTPGFGFVAAVAALFGAGLVAGLRGRRGGD